MKRFESVEQILDFAIAEEVAAAEFYAELGRRMDRPWMKQVFEEFALEEKGHRAKLEAVKKGGLKGLPVERVLDLQIGDYLVDATPEKGMDYQQALILAMKKEKAAFRMYSDLASASDDAGLKNLLLGLAQEEARHKLRFELEYDEQYLKEN
jgi:rubrerythrin